MAPRSSFRIVTDDVRAIRVLREKKRLSVNKAAPVIGTNKSTLTALENGRINLSRQWIEKILKGYRTSWEDFERLKEQRLSSKETLIDEMKSGMRLPSLAMKSSRRSGSFLLVFNSQPQIARTNFLQFEIPYGETSWGTFLKFMGLYTMTKELLTT